MVSSKRPQSPTRSPIIGQEPSAKFRQSTISSSFRATKSRATAPRAKSHGDKIPETIEDVVVNDPKRERKPPRQRQRPAPISGISNSDQKIFHLDENDPRYATYWDTIEAQSLSGQNPQLQTHQEGLTIPEKILQHFDQIEKFGPYIGLSRIERWRRAKWAGLDPDEIVGEILESVEGCELPQLRDVHLGIVD